MYHSLMPVLISIKFLIGLKNNTFVRLSLVFTSDISISKITKDKFSSEVYEDKTQRIFFRICFCSTIAYARSLMLVFMLISMLMSHALVVIVDFFVLFFYLVLTLMSLVRSRLQYNLVPEVFILNRNF